MALLGACEKEATLPLDGVTVEASRYTGYRAVANTTLTRAAVLRSCPASEVSTTPDCDWQYELATAPPAWADVGISSMWDAARDRPDAYAVFTKQSATRTESVIVLGPKTPAIYGMSALHNGNAAITPDTIDVPTAIIDWGSFPLRGIVEGFYGKPYSESERIRVLRCLASLKGNAYLYAPKGDPFVHSRWREPYPTEMATHLRMLRDFSGRQGIRFFWGIAPGAVDDQTKTIAFSSAADRAVFFAKIDTILALGITDFSLLFDDISLVLPLVDQGTFASPAEAHATLANELYTYLVAKNPEARLLFVGLAYTDQHPDWTSYTDVLGQMLVPGVDVIWTGPNTFSKTLAAADFASVTASIRRKPILWDNYPTEPIKPVDRAADLPAGINGFLSNPMLNENGYRPLSEFLAVFGPLSRYTWNADSDLPTAYDDWNRDTLAATCGLD